VKPVSKDDLMVVRLLAEVQDLTAAVRQLIELTPTRHRTWLPPREFARIVGCSTRTLGNWRFQGRFRDCSVRQHGTGWQFHADLALQDAQASQKEVG